MLTAKVLGLTLACLLLPACSGPRGGIQPGPKPAETKTSQPSEITFERIFNCEGPCPLYKVVLRQDGTASYEGAEHAERKGKYHATGANDCFLNLSKMIEKSQYASLQDLYGPGGKDEDAVITSVVENGTRKTVVDRGSHGPIELWAIEMSFEGCISRIQWEKD